MVVSRGYAFLRELVRYVSGAFGIHAPQDVQKLFLIDVQDVEAKELCKLLKITEASLHVRLHRAGEAITDGVRKYQSERLIVRSSRGEVFTMAQEEVWRILCLWDGKRL